MKKIAVTGGIAVGKSSLCCILSRLGYPVISADSHAKKALSPNASIHSTILKLFQFEKTLDPQVIAQKIFSYPRLKKQFEDIIHPWIIQSILTEEKEFKKKGCRVIFYEIPLLFEKNLESDFDFIVLVNCKKNIQKVRLMNRMSISKSQAEKRINSQWTQKEKFSKSDLIVDNNSKIDHLEKSALMIIKKFNLKKDSHA